MGSEAGAETERGALRPHVFVLTLSLFELLILPITNDNYDQVTLISSL